MAEQPSLNERVVAEFRANGGRVGGPFAGMPLVLLHHVGRTSGREFVTPAAYLPVEGTDDAVYVFATNGGAAENPGWYANLVAAGTARIERGTRTVTVSVRELTGDERDAVYAEQVRRAPGFAEYERATAGVRVIPVLELVRTGTG
ncbi:nitroreductase family deazaflavin-dependent oxidoreductase [Kineococcus sp. SYSU DK004]|uniref:nitroreductase family deazaflavin-dependent oxidoreductase n=1 Tax=Kineococcus sp. SYSU DK004 TaxID=3383125 RepID=UPI003D7EBC1E